MEACSPISLQLLQTIAGQQLPLTITDPCEIQQLRVLRAAGYIAVFLPAPQASNGFARVLTITADGRKALQDHAASTDAPH